MSSKSSGNSRNIEVEDRRNIVSRMLADFPYSPSPIRVVDAVLELAELGSKDVLVDLGPYCYLLAIEYISTGKVRIDRIVTHAFPL